MSLTLSSSPPWGPAAPTDLAGRAADSGRAKTAHAGAAQTVGLVGDRFLMATLVLAVAGAQAVAWAYDGIGLALAAGAILLALGAAALWLFRGTLASRMVLSLCVSAAVALHIQLARGTTEFHFGVFVVLALVMVYRDWRPIVAVAGFFAVHHLSFDRLQALGFELYCTTEAGLARVLLHAAYVVVQAALEIYLVLRLGALSRQGEELGALMKAMQADGRIALDVRHVDVHSPGARTLRDLLLRIQTLLVDVRDSTGRIDSVGSRVGQDNRDLGDRTEQAGTELARTTQAVQALSRTVQQSADFSARGQDLAGSATALAKQGSGAVQQLIDSMGRIQSSSEQIAEITGVIDAIAFQTNILALNAAVEAARAGEQGRGFAVVASEVRALAQRSASAARQIKVLITDSVDSVDSGSQHVQAVDATMRQVLDSVQQMAGLIGQISAGAREQARDVGHVSGAVDRLGDVTAQNAALVRGTLQTAEQLREQTARLAQVAAAFQLDAAPAPTVRG